MSAEKGNGPELPGPPEDAASLRSPVQSSRSEEVSAVLARQKGRPAHFYGGALRVLADQANPVRAEMAAYALRELIQELERAAGLDDANEDDLSRRDRAQETLAGLDPVQRVGPPDTMEARIEALLGFRRDFNRALHGERPTDPELFSSLAERFETFLLAWFQPRTFDDYSELDEVLEEGPPT
jgi:hypothetical protein